jgi:hypothetical protein
MLDHVSSPPAVFDLTTRGLTAHLQEAVLDTIVEEQVDLFHRRLRADLQKHVTSITLGHIEHVQDVLKLRDELTIRVDVTMDGASA